MTARSRLLDETRLVLRRNMQSKWIWVLLTADSHIVNRSETDFETRRECTLDASRNGFTSPV